MFKLERVINGRTLMLRMLLTLPFSLYAALAMNTVLLLDSPFGFKTRTRKMVTAMQMLTGQATPVISSPRESRTEGCSIE